MRPDILTLQLLSEEHDVAVCSQFNLLGEHHFEGSCKGVAANEILLENIDEERRRPVCLEVFTVKSYCIFE